MRFSFAASRCTGVASSFVWIAARLGTLLRKADLSVPRIGAVKAALAVALVLFLAGRVAVAAPGVELVYERSERAASCPDAAALRLEVAKRLGTDPFVDKADGGRKIVARIDRRGTGEFHGEVRLESDVVPDEDAPSRELDAVDCSELVASMALTASVLLEPLAGRHKRVLPPPSTTTTKRELPDFGPPSAPASAPPTPPLPAGTGVDLRLGAFAVGAALAAPTVDLGFDVIAGIAIGPRGGAVRWTIDAGARFDLESGKSSDSHGARTSLFVGEIAPCRRVGPVGLCAVVEVGALRGQIPPTSGAGKHAESTAYAALGPRIALEIPVGAGFAIATHFEAAGVLTRTTLRAGHAELWTTPPLALSLALGLTRTFP